MTLDKFLEAMWTGLPLALTIAMLLGGGKLAAPVVRVAWHKLKAFVKGTKNKVDDAIVLPLEKRVLNVADDLEEGKIDVGAAVTSLRGLVDAAKAPKGPRSN